MKLGEVLLFIRNGKSCIQNKDWIGSKVTRIETIAAGFIDENRVGYFDISKEDQEKYEIKKGDILFSHINSPSHIWKVAIAQKDYTDLFHGMNLLLIRWNAKINANFLYILLSRFFLRGTRSKLCKKAINQASLNQKNIIDLQIPLLSLEEQKQIVTYLDQVHSHISTLKDQVNTQITRCDELWQSSLKKILQSGISEMKEQE